jgi:hypothetical protein
MPVWVSPIRYMARSCSSITPTDARVPPQAAADPSLLGGRVAW